MKNLLEHYYPLNEYRIRVDTVVEKTSAYRCRICHLIDKHKEECPIKLWDEINFEKKEDK